MFDSTLEPGWAPFTASGLSQWGPPIPRTSWASRPAANPCCELRSMISALRGDNEFDLTSLRGMLSVANS